MTMLGSWMDDNYQAVAA